jgi:hypothetical protein
VFTNHFIIIDNFYLDPDQVRDIALNMPLDQNSGKYAGRMTQEAFFNNDHKEIFKLITKMPEIVPGTTLCGKFRFSLAQDTEIQHIHFDPAPMQVWAGVIYLSLPEHYEPVQNTQGSCGTQFWCHRRTGLDHLPLDLSSRIQHGWHSVDDLKEFLENEGIDESLWQPVFDVPMRYNRLVLFRPWMFHSSGFRFGDSRENCRLVQTMFLSLPQE